MEASKICVNDYIKKIIINTDVVPDSNKLELGPPPQMVREPLHIENETHELICDGSFNNFIMPEPCGKCYSLSCHGTCDEKNDDTELIPRQLSFEEEMDLPPPEPLRRMLTNAHLPEDPPEDEDNFDFPEGTQYISMEQITDSDEELDEVGEDIREKEDAYDEAVMKQMLERFPHLNKPQN